MAEIVIVDDDRGMRSLLRALLERQGHACREAADGDAARKLLDERPAELLLCDVRLGRESGLDVVRELGRSHPETAALMVSGVDDAVVWEEALEIGCYGYLTKPVPESALAIGVANALRRRQLERNVLTSAYEETVRRLALAAEYRDVETGRHVERMSSYCAILARRLGVDAARCEEIRLAALLHDVGKIGIPDAILRTPAELSAEEWEQVRRHPELGHRLLAGSGSPLLELAATIALTHHERVNGSGYPRGLRGDEIPLEGRIAAVADVFDALTSERVYQAAHRADDARAMLESGRGTLFDPAVLDAFDAARDEIEAVRASVASAGSGGGT
ncbi:MAG TPA: HD domain-containing phosphohydrolase [Gaiellaceae bacterium]|nr:HD domain-containing phosphohydrolase [Gaiellaceae bacterium]